VFLDFPGEGSSIMRRRTFLKRAALLPFAFRPALLAAEQGAKERNTDIVILGGGAGGCAAALAAADAGYRVILTEETDWVGGQLTAQAVPPDEHPWIESRGATRRSGNSAWPSANTTADTIRSRQKLALSRTLIPVMVWCRAFALSRALLLLSLANSWHRISMTDAFCC
jgi:uncharacterized protein (DUF1501 family)